MVTTKKMVGFISGTITCQKVWKVEAPSTLAASSTDSGMDWSPARKISMKVPIVVQVTRMMMANIATLGPAIHCQNVTPMNSFSTITAGAWSTPSAPRAMWNRPLALSSQLIVSKGRMALIAP